MLDLGSGRSRRLPVEDARRPASDSGAAGAGPSGYDGEGGPGTVAAAMLTRPKTMPAAVSVGDVRSAFRDDHVHLLLLTDGTALRGTLCRGDVPAEAEDAGPALPHARLRGRTVSPDCDAEAARLAMIARGLRRLAVTAPDGRLLGLLALKRKQTGFCTDAGVAERAAELFRQASRRADGTRPWPGVPPAAPDVAARVVRRTAQASTDA